MDTKQILILIGFAIYYFIRSSGKKEKDQKSQPRKQSQQRPKRAPQRSIEDILRDLAGETQPRKSSTKEIFIEPEEIAIETPTENKPRRTHETIENKKLEVEHDDEDTGESTFDLRQAVINDAILNRPHHW